MDKEEIIKIANSMNFKLDYDQSEVESKKWIRFISNDNNLDEKDLRWIWYIEDDWTENIERGNYIESRLKKKKQIQESLKY
jgi:hypothetical protein